MKEFVIQHTSGRYVGDYGYTADAEKAEMFATEKGVDSWRCEYEKGDGSMTDVKRTSRVAEEYAAKHAADDVSIQEMLKMAFIDGFSYALEQLAEGQERLRLMKGESND